MRLSKFVWTNIILPAIVSIVLNNLGIMGCGFGLGVYIPVPCWLLNFLLGMALTAVLLDLIVYVIWPKRNMAKWTEPRLDILPRAGIPMILNRPRYQSAELEIVNLDELEITECYGTLIELSHMRQVAKLGWVRVIPSIQGQPDRIRWIEHKESNDAYEIKIPAIDSRHIDLADTMESRILGFNLRSGKFAPSEGPEEDSMPAYTVTIRIDGKYDGKSMKPQRFDGYLYWETKKLRTIVNLQQPDGKFVEEIHEQDSIPLLRFEKGDWMKDKKLKQQLGLDNEREKKKEIFTKEDFLKALKKVTRPIQPKVSRGKGKSKTSA